MVRYDPRQEFPVEYFSGFHIDGKWVTPSSGASFALVSPSTEESMGLVPMGVEADVDLAVAAARKAFDEGPWPYMEVAQRSALVTKLAKALTERLPVLERAWTGLVGGPTSFARFFLNRGPAIFDYYAMLAESYPWTEKRATSIGHAEVVREPVGVCALIVPWNSPLIILAYKLAPALIAGCTVVVKPSPETPFEALLIAQIASEIGFPPGVINVVPGEREAGRHLVAHPDIDKVSFTGSTTAGIAVATACAGRLARISLELGGKSAAIVMKDAALDGVLASLVPWSMPFSGQTCFSQTRLLVHRSRLDEVTNAYSGAIGALCVGDPWDPATQVGPLVNAHQMSSVLDKMDLARRQGAEAVVGGGRDERFNRGYYIQPTVFTGVTPDMSIAREETFGPVVSITAFDSEDEAIAIANNTDYGLHGSIYSADIRRATRMARRIRTGSVAINVFNNDQNAPFGGFKRSGIGREGGPEGLNAFIEPKSIYLPDTLEL